MQRVRSGKRVTSGLLESRSRTLGIFCYFELRCKEEPFRIVYRHQKGCRALVLIGCQVQECPAPHEDQIATDLLDGVIEYARSTFCVADKAERSCSVICQRIGLLRVRVFRIHLLLQRRSNVSALFLTAS